MIFNLMAAATGAFIAPAYYQKQAAEAQEAELKRQAEDEKVAAEGRELQRRRELNRALSANIVSQAASGISGEGTPESIALASAKNVSISEGMETLSDRLRVAQLRRQGQNVGLAGTYQAAGTLFETGKSMLGLL